MLDSKNKNWYGIRAVRYFYSKQGEREGLRMYRIPVWLVFF